VGPPRGGGGDWAVVTSNAEMKGNISPTGTKLEDKKILNSRPAIDLASRAVLGSAKP
jgi:hypothetical protein